MIVEVSFLALPSGGCNCYGRIHRLYASCVVYDIILHSSSTHVTINFATLYISVTARIMYWSSYFFSTIFLPLSDILFWHVDENHGVHHLCSNTANTLIVIKYTDECTIIFLN